jgi:hypothetical protein
MKTSIRMCLRRKFKKFRQPLVSSDKVAEIRAKFGRPGVSGRKRKVQQSTDNTELKKRNSNKVTLNLTWPINSGLVAILVTTKMFPYCHDLTFETILMNFIWLRIIPILFHCKYHVVMLVKLQTLVYEKRFIPFVGD